MARQPISQQIRADFADRLSRWLRTEGISVVKLGQIADVNHETVRDAAENRRAVRPTTIAKIRRGMETYEQSRIADPSPGEIRTAAIIQKGDPAYEFVSQAVSNGTLVMIDDKKVRVFTITEKA